MRKIFFLTLLFFSITLNAATPQPLPADQAFQFSATAKDYQTILVQWKIAPNYFLYATKFSFKIIQPNNIVLGNPLYPSDTQRLQTTLGAFSVYAHHLIIPIPVMQTDQKSLILQVKYQGCAKAGYCYSPTTKTVSKQ